MIKGIFKVMYTLMYNALLKINLFVPRMDRYSTIGYDQIIAYSAKAAGIPENDMRATMDALMEAFDYFVTNGHSFKLDGVGTFSLSANTKTGDPDAEVCVEGADAISRLRINFLPDKSLKDICANLSIITETENPENLRPLTSAMLRDVVVNDTKIVDNTEYSGLGVNIKNTNVLRVYGYNLPNVLPVTLIGENFSKEVRISSNRSRTIAGATIPMTETGALKSIQVLGKTFNITGDPSATDISSVYYGEFDVFEGAILPSGTHELVATGNSLDGAELLVDGVAVPLTHASNKRVSADVTMTGSTTGEAHILKIGSQTFNVVVTTLEKFASVRSLTANGISVPNGSSSPVVPGVPYKFVITGQSLNNLSAESIVAPASAVVYNVYFAPERATFEVVFGEIAEGDTIKIGPFFSVGLSGGNPSQTVTSIGGAANGGTVSLGAGTQTLAVVASSQLTQAQIKTEGGVTVTGVNGNNISVNVSGNGILRVYDAENDALTIFTLNITQSGAQVQQYTITAQSDSAETGSVQINNGTVGANVTYTGNEGEKVTVKAIPAQGYEFSDWSDGNVNETREVTLTENMNLTAQFTQA